MYPKMFGVFLQALKNNCYEKRFVIQTQEKKRIQFRKKKPRKHYTNRNHRLLEIVQKHCEV